MRVLLPWLSSLALSLGVTSTAMASSQDWRNPECAMEHQDVVDELSREYDQWLADEEARWRDLYRELRAMGADEQTLAAVEAEGRAVLRGIRAERRAAVNGFLEQVCGGGEPCDPDQENCEPPCDPDQQDCEPDPCDPDRQDCEPQCVVDGEPCEPDCGAGENCEPDPCGPDGENCEPDPCGPDGENCEPDPCGPDGENCEPDPCADGSCEPPCGYNGEYCEVECNAAGQCRVCSELTNECEICDPNQDCWL